MIIALLTLDLNLTLTVAFKIRQPPLKSFCVVLRYNCAKFCALLQRVTIIPLSKSTNIRNNGINCTGNVVVSVKKHYLYTKIMFLINTQYKQKKELN